VLLFFRVSFCGCHDTHLNIAFKGEFWSRSQPKEVEAILKKSLTLPSINTLQLENSRKNTKINTKADFELGNGRTLVEVSGSEVKGVIEIAYFYAGGNLFAIPEVTTIIPKISNQD
jgi:hypothetical protein